MNLMKRNSAVEVTPRFFDSFLMKDLFDVPVVPTLSSRSVSQLPAVNIVANEDSFVVEMAAPGLKRDQIKVELDNDLLTIAYQEESNKEEKSERPHYVLREFNSHSFSRRFTLPEGVINEEGVAASYEDGVLRLVLPKREEAKPKAPRQIQIS